jgi:hypothetical protein
MESACDMNGDKINAYKVSVGKSKDNWPLWKSGHRQNNNIKMDLKEIGCGLNVSGWGQGPQHSDESSGFIKCWKFIWAAISFTRRALVYGVGWKKLLCIIIWNLIDSSWRCSKIGTWWINKLFLTWKGIKLRKSDKVIWGNEAIN